jgi:2-dehydropantoate 2-reductase
VNALIVGGGAVGSFLAATLTLGGATVTLVRHRVRAGQRTATIVLIRGDIGHEVRVNVASTVTAADRDVNVVFVAVKAYDVTGALDSLPIDAGTLVTIQNGIGTEQLVREWNPDRRLVAASLTASIELNGNDVIWRRKGGIGLASVNGGEDQLRDLVESFRAAGLPARIYPDWRSMKWSKLIANLVGNATSALGDMTVAQVYAHPGLFEIEREQLQEAFRVVRALGLKPVSLPGADVTRLELGIGLPSPVARTILGFAVAAGRGGKDPSLRLALAAGTERTEVDWLNGAVARAADAVGVEAPVNEALTNLVARAATDGALRERLRGNPDSLVEAVSAFRHGDVTRPTDRIAAG